MVKPTALQTLDQLANELPDYGMLPASAANVALEAQRYDEAIFRSQQLLQLMPNYLPAQLTLAERSCSAIRSGTNCFEISPRSTRKAPRASTCWQRPPGAAGLTAGVTWPAPSTCSLPVEWTAAFDS